MKKLILIALAALALAGAVVGFILHHSNDQDAGKSAAQDDSPPLEIEAAQETLTTEQGFEGQREFTFKNLRENPVTVGIVLKDCQCSRIQICLTPEEWKQLEPQEQRKRAVDPALHWETLEQDSQGFSVPPGAAGLLRLGWKGKDAGDHRFGARLWIDDRDKRLNQHVQVPVHVIPPVVIRSESNRRWPQADVGRMSNGEERTAKFVCYSVTRAKFTLTPAPPLPEPCISYEPPKPLSDAELKTLSEQTGKTVLSGCRVDVKVHERVKDSQLDLGPFRRHVVWNTDVAPGHQVSGIVSGNVLGEVKLAQTNKTFVDLGNISPDKPTPITLTLESTDPQIELALDEKHTLDLLSVELVDGKAGKEAENKKTWQVRILFNKDSGFHGRFPIQTRPGYDTDVACSVVFQLSRKSPSGDSASDPVRRLYVPVRGVVP
jgi:hypothetical protein